MRALVLASLVASAAAALASPELRDWPMQLATPAAVPPPPTPSTPPTLQTVTPL